MSQNAGTLQIRRPELAFVGYHSDADASERLRAKVSVEYLNENIKNAHVIIYEDLDDSMDDLGRQSSRKAPSGMDPLESEPYLAERFGVRVPNLSTLVRRLHTGTIFAGTYSTVYPGMYRDEKVGY